MEINPMIMENPFAIFGEFNFAHPDRPTTQAVQLDINQQLSWSQQHSNADIAVAIQRQAERN